MTHLIVQLVMSRTVEARTVDFADHAHIMVNLADLVIECGTTIFVR